MRLPTGHLRKRGNIWWCQWKNNGTPYAQSLKTSDAQTGRKAFERTMALVRASIAEGSHAQKYGHDGTSTVEDGDIRLSDVWRHYCGSASRPDASPQTIEQYEIQWGCFLDWLRTRHPTAVRFSQVSRAIAQEFASHLASRDSANTFNKYIQLFRLVFRVISADLGRMVNPWLDIQKKKVNGKGSHGRRDFTPEEVRRIFIALWRRIEGRHVTWAEDGSEIECKAGDREQECAGEMLTVALLGFHAGLRLGDCCLLEWGSVDWGKMELSVIPAKTARSSGKRVTIPIHPELADHLSAIRPEKATGYVCPGKAAQYRKNRSDVTKRFHTLFQQCGIRTNPEKTNPNAKAVCEVGFHSLRHTWVTRSFEDGVDQITVRAVVGWGSPAMERTYTHVSAEHLKAQLSKRTSTAFPAMEAKKETPPLPAVGTMSDAQIKELSQKLAEELARRGEGK